MPDSPVDVDRYLPPEGPEARRWEHTRMRRRILDGDWRSDLQERLREHLAPTRHQNLGRPVLAVNLLKSIASQLAVLYDRSPTLNVDEADAEGEEEVVELLNEMSAWSILQRNAEQVIGLRESLVFVGWSETRQVPTLRLVAPDTVIVEADPEDPHQLVMVKEARPRQKAGRDGKPEWDVFWDVWDIRDPANPSFRIETRDGADVTVMVPGLAEQVGRPYPYIDENGKPYIPGVLYHAQDVGRLWDYLTWSEVVEGTLDCGVLWSLFFHSCRDASWRQKYGINVQVGGGQRIDMGGGESAQAVETAPSSVVLFTTVGDKPGSVGTFDAPIEPAKFAEAVLDFQRTVVSHIGINPADLERSESAGSGYAIQLKRSAQRKMGLRFEPQFRRADLELIRKVCLIANLHGGRNLPVDGFSLTYHPIEETAAERKDELEYSQALVEAGQMSRVDLYQQLNPGVTVDMAVERLVEIEALNRGIISQAAAILEEMQRQALTPEMVMGSAVEREPAPGTELNDFEEDHNV